MAVRLCQICAFISVPVCLFVSAVLRAAVRHSRGEGDEKPAGRSQARHGISVRYEGHSTGKSQRSGRNWTQGIVSTVNVELVKELDDYLWYF